MASVVVLDSCGLFATHCAKVKPLSMRSKTGFVILEVMFSLVCIQEFLRPLAYMYIVQVLL